MLFALTAATATFFLVPRGVSVGEINIQADHLSFNTSKGTYWLELSAHIPVFNPNYLQAVIEGDLRVSFYDAQAGLKTIEAQSVSARSWPSIIKVTMDASNVPPSYALTMLSQCNLFPRRLIFFLRGTIRADYLGQHQLLSPVDTYFLIDCKRGTSTPNGDGGQPIDALVPVLSSASSAGQGLQDLLRDDLGSAAASKPNLMDSNSAAPIAEDLLPR